MRNNPLELHAVPAFPIIAIVRNPFRLPKALSRVPRGSHLWRPKLLDFQCGSSFR